MDLIVLRHGEAGTRMPVPSRDSERALTAAGRREVEEVARSLESLKLEINCIASSPLARSLETAQIVAKELNKSKELEVWDELRPEGDRSALYERLAKLKPETSVLLVGHEPYLSFLISDLIAGNTRTRLVLRKAGMAKVSLNSMAPRPTGELRWLLTPRQIKKLS